MSSQILIKADSFVNHSLYLVLYNITGTIGPFDLRIANLHNTQNSTVQNDTKQE